MPSKKKAAPKIKRETFKQRLMDRGYRHAYAESFTDSWLAAQIKVIREQRGLTQTQLAEMVGTKQAGISRLENVNHTGWQVTTLTKIAAALDVRLKISFETFDGLQRDARNFSLKGLRRRAHKEHSR